MEITYPDPNHMRHADLIHHTQMHLIPTITEDMALGKGILINPHKKESILVFRCKYIPLYLPILNYVSDIYIPLYYHLRAFNTTNNPLGTPFNNQYADNKALWMDKDHLADLGATIRGEEGKVILFIFKF